MRRARITAKNMNIAVGLRPDQIPRVVPEEGPAGKVLVQLELEGGALRVSAIVSGKSYRKMLKTIDTNEGRVSIVLQGTLRGQAPDRRGVLEVTGAGFAVSVKSPLADGSLPPAQPTRPPEILPPGSQRPGVRVYVPPIKPST